MDLTFTDEEYEEMAIQAIRNHLNKKLTNDDIKQKFSLAIKRMIFKAKKIDFSKPVGVKSIKEGDISISYENQVDTLIVDDEIKALLPSPYVKMF